MSKVILYVATSLDGFIADKDGGVDWLPPPVDDPTDVVGFKTLMNRISTIVMGRRSYDQILGFGEWEWKDKQTYVFTSQPLSTTSSYIVAIQDNPRVFMDKLKSSYANSDVWLLGGAKLIKSFAGEKLIDECIITVIPVNLKEGIKLELTYDDFTFISEKSCMEGIVQKTYWRKEK